MTAKPYEPLDQEICAIRKVTSANSYETDSGSFPKFAGFAACLALLLFLGSIAVSEATQSPVDISVAERLADEALGKEEMLHQSLRNVNTKIVLLEGDSWFDLPWPHTDIADVLVNRGLTVISVAKRGDTLENMAYSDQLADIILQLRRIAGYGRAPSAIVLSFGGNDIIGSHLSLALDHSRSLANGDSGQINWRSDIMNGMLDRYQKYVKDYLAALSLTYDRFFRSLVSIDIRENTFLNVPILVHGYDYPSATGAGFKFLWLVTTKGPWIKPTFNKKMYDNDSEINESISEVIDQFNARLNFVVEELNNSGQIRNPICYVDLRGIVSGRNDWSDELHPSRRGMISVAEELLSVLSDPSCNPHASEWLNPPNHEE